MDEKIDDLLSGKMSPRERESFVKEVNQNPSLKGELDQKIKSNNDIPFNSFNELMFKSKKRHFWERKIGFLTKNLDKRFYYVVGALVFVVLLLVVALPTIKRYGANERILFEKYYVPYKPSTDIDYQDPVFQDVSGTMEAYANKKYFEAIIRFQKLLENNQDLVFVKFYLGLSFIETNQYNKAEAILGEVVEVENNIYHDPAIWYLGLIHLKQNQNEKAKEYFKNLLQDQNLYRDKAEEILNSLD